MLSKRDQGKLYFAVIMGTLLTLASLLFGLTWPGLVSQAGPTLPPIDPPTATPAPDPATPVPDPATPVPVPSSSGGDSRDDDSDAPPIAHIKLQASTGGWSVVQWQDTAGNWHDVEGWRGTLSATGVRHWVVEAKDFKTGPFRWLVMQGQSGEVVGISDSFNLPAEVNALLQVTVVAR